MRVVRNKPCTESERLLKVRRVPCGSRSGVAGIKSFTLFEMSP